jgi:glycosyltransferase involved in cell wall biosynthesis
MKVAIGHRVVEGPWGGGNRFVRFLVEQLEADGHRAVFALDDPDIDVVLIIDPRARNPQTTFTPGHVLRYLMFRNPGAVVVHRINECDERKGTKGMNARLRLANYCADHTVFIASWLRDLAVWRRDLGRPSSVILNGADPRIFHASGYRPWDGREPLRLVTHHWGGNRMKGFDVYERIDSLLEQPAWRDRLAFTYVGNLPAGFRFRNAAHLAPLADAALADELRRHHVYVTASINEPAGMHHIEGAMCGLPLLYRASGALPEYCDGYGIRFDGPDIDAALEAMIATYPQWQTRMPAYGRTAQMMAARYVALFGDLLSRRDTLVRQRRIFAEPLTLLASQLPI